MITTHRLSAADFAELGAGGGGVPVVARLRDAQVSKHVLLVHAVLSGLPPDPAVRAARELLSSIQVRAPQAGAWLFGLPQIGGWAYDTLVRGRSGLAPDTGFLSAAAAAAAIRAGIPFELQVPVRGGTVTLPGLGRMLVPSEHEQATVRCDGTKAWAVTAEGRYEGWSYTPRLRVAEDGLTLDVPLEAHEPYLDRYPEPCAGDLGGEEIELWRRRAQEAWTLLVRRHRETAAPIAAGLRAVVPLRPRRRADLVSATSPVAAGAIATSPPPDAVTFAETLVHEFQHVKLCAIMDLVRLAEPGGTLCHAPWRDDPRPVGGLLQGVYAHLGIARFWRAERHAGDDLRGQVSYARWRTEVSSSARTLLRSGQLTDLGARFVRDMLDQAGQWQDDLVPVPAQSRADQEALTHWLVWQARHLVAAPADIADLADRWLKGDRPERRAAVQVVTGARLITGDLQGPGTDDAAAIRACRERITASSVLLPDAWVGLALAANRSGRTPRDIALAEQLVPLFTLYDRLREMTGERLDPLDLADWLAS